MSSAGIVRQVFHFRTAQEQHTFAVGDGYNKERTFGEIIMPTQANELVGSDCGSCCFEDYLTDRVTRIARAIDITDLCTNIQGSRIILAYALTELGWIHYRGSALVNIIEIIPTNEREHIAGWWVNNMQQAETFGQAAKYLGLTKGKLAKLIRQFVPSQERIG